MLYVWNADGSGIPLVLEGHQSRIHQIRWSPDSTFVASSSNDGTVRLWFNIDKAPSLATLSADLWRTSVFCMTIKQRRETLGVTEEMAQKDLQQCQARAIVPTMH